MNLHHELAIVIKAVKEAGRIALLEQKSLMVSYKPHGQGPVTNVDIAVDRYLVNYFSTYFPDDIIISEESYDNNLHFIPKKRVWFLDPIDGTRALVSGLDDFVIMVGLAIDGQAELGVIYQPNTDILWQGCARHQLAIRSFKNKDTILKASDMPAMSELTLVASISHNSKCQEQSIHLLQPKKIIYKGSLGLKAMLVIEGEADLSIAWSSNINLWDSCAPTAIIKAAGAYICSIDQEELEFYGDFTHKKPIIISRAKLSTKTYQDLKKLI